MDFLRHANQIELLASTSDGEAEAAVIEIYKTTEAYPITRDCAMGIVKTFLAKTGDLQGAIIDLKCHLEYCTKEGLPLRESMRGRLVWQV